MMSSLEKWSRRKKIADNGGVKVALSALDTWMNFREQDSILFAGLNITNHQLFFLSYAQVSLILLVL